MFQITEPPLAKQCAAAAARPSSHFEVIGLFVPCKYLRNLYQVQVSGHGIFFSPLCPLDKAHSALEHTPDS